MLLGVGAGRARTWSPRGPRCSAARRRSRRSSAASGSGSIPNGSCPGRAGSPRRPCRVASTPGSSSPRCPTTPRRRSRPTRSSRMPGTRREPRSTRWPTAGSGMWLPTSTTLQQLEHATSLEAIAAAAADPVEGEVVVEVIDDEVTRVTMPAGGGVAGQPVHAYLVGRRACVLVDPGDPTGPGLDRAIDARRRARRADRGGRPDPGRPRSRRRRRGPRRTARRPRPGVTPPGARPPVRRPAPRRRRRHRPRGVRAAGRRDPRTDARSPGLRHRRRARSRQRRPRRSAWRQGHPRPDRRGRLARRPAPACRRRRPAPDGSAATPADQARSTGNDTARLRRKLMPSSTISASASGPGSRKHGRPARATPAR